MGTYKSVSEAAEFFKGDKFATTNGMVLEDLGEDYSVCSMVLGENHRNALGGVMGGVTFTLADFAFAILSNQIHSPSVAQQVDIIYLSAPKGTKLTAKAKCRKSGRTSTVINVDVVDDTGRDIAQYTAIAHKL
ncbi:MAG: PaaI family thioesterase [Clostridia bacterium]|nr:PaaI family thioesterase [Clostridia bacterium]